MIEPSHNIDKLVAELTLEEKARLTAGEDMWSTVAIERLGIPKVRMTDGPNGARGSALFGAGPATAACAPCGSALGATWNVGLVERVGAMIGDEARTKACRVLLGPTVNIHRSPAGWPQLRVLRRGPAARRGGLAAAFVRGVQSRRRRHHGQALRRQRRRVRAQHDQLGDRRARACARSTSCPFELAVREGGALGIMTAYNRLNGTFCAEHDGCSPASCAASGASRGSCSPTGTPLGSTAGSAAAGLDLEMPGPGRLFGPALAERSRPARSTRRGSTPRVRRLLGVFDRSGALDDAPDVDEPSVDRPEHRALGREGGGRGDGAVEERRRAAVGPRAHPRPGGDRAERRSGSDHGWRVGQPAAPLPHHSSGGDPRTPERPSYHPSRAGLRHGAYDAAAWGDTIEHAGRHAGASGRVLRRSRPRRRGGAPTRQSRQPPAVLRRAGARRPRGGVLVPGHWPVHAGGRRPAHLHARAGRPGPCTRRWRGPPRRHERSATARPGALRPGQRGDHGDRRARCLPAL